jgi:riboflavin biosynthesis pyrimidine reductase
MKPYVICHMVASIDGRTLISRWRPADARRRELFERLHDRLGVDAWLVGRVTGHEYARRESYPNDGGHSYAREPWFGRRDAAAFGVVLDAKGKIAWGRADIGGDPIVVVLTEQVSDAHLAGLRKDGVSYIFAGRRELDLALALEILNRELGIKRLEVNGGGITNGAFLRAGLVDEISLAIFPAVDGAKGAPCVFDSADESPDTRPPVGAMTLASSEVLDGGAVWLRYRIENAQSHSGQTEQ